MPMMPRVNKKTKKIAYSILGIPANIKSKKTPRQKRINERLIFDYTTLVR